MGHTGSAREAFRTSTRALRHRNFRLYWIGQLVSLVGSWMQSVAQGWLMHRLTASALMLGVLTFAQFAPVLPLALWAGVVADHSDRRRMILATQTAMLVQAAILAITVSAGVVRPWMVLALAAMYGVANTFDLPARQTFVIDMVGREDLSNGIALNSAAFNTARIIGPAIAGLTLAWVGEAGCFWINALSFLAVIYGLSRMRITQRPPMARGSAASTLREGLDYAWRSGPIRNLLVLLAICAGMGFQYNVLLPVYARDVLHAGPAVYGWLFSAFGAGSLVAAARMTALHDRWSLRRHLLLGLVCAGVGMAGFAWMRALPAMLAFGALAGFGLILYVSSTNMIIQSVVEDRFRGRIMSLYTLMFIGTSPFGALLAGAIAQRFGAPVATSVCALILLGGALWMARRLRVIAAREAAGAVPPPSEPEPDAVS